MEYLKFIGCSALICLIIPLAIAVISLNWLQYKRLAKAKGIPYRFDKWLFSLTFVLPSMYASFLVLTTYKLIVHLILSIKLGSKFGGLLKGQDAWYAFNYPKVVIIPVVMFIEFDNKSDNIFEVLKEFICTSLKTKLKDKSKVCGILQNSLGYYYILKDKIKIEDCIKKFKTTSRRAFSKAEFIQLVEEYAEESLPDSSRGFWEVSIGTQPVKWDADDNDDSQLFPIVIKFSHCMGDGVNLYKALWKIFGDIKNLPNPSLPKYPNFKKELSIFNVLDAISRFMNLPIMPILLVNEDIVAVKTDTLIAPKQIPKKYFCVSEDRSTHYLSIVKEIKKNLPFNSSVTNIFITAFNASLTEFYHKYTSNTPKHITYSVTESRESINLRSTTPDNLKNQKVNCTNAVGLMILNYQTITQSKNEEVPIMKMLLENSKQKNVIQELQESQAYFKIFGTLFSVLPIPVVKYLMSKESTTAIVTNLPGPPSMTIMNGTLVKHLTLWCPHVSRTGISLALLTFGGKLEITLNVDRNLVSKRSQVQEILSGIYKYLDIMHNKVCSR